MAPQYCDRDNVSVRPKYRKLFVVLRSVYPRILCLYPDTNITVFRGAEQPAGIPGKQSVCSRCLHTGLCRTFIALQSSVT
jgi:hypothetical protein